MTGARVVTPNSGCGKRLGASRRLLGSPTPASCQSPDDGCCGFAVYVAALENLLLGLALDGGEGVIKKHGGIHAQLVIDGMTEGNLRSGRPPDDKCERV
jgi:hypothetical protein